MQATSDKQQFVIVGGGTAGWMAACLLAHHWRDKVDVTLVESPEIGIIGVGEGSTPTLKRFFSDLGIAESEWMPRCHATYKTNIRFVDWSPESGIDSYSHPFISQLDTFSERAFYLNCLTRRLGLDVETTPEKLLFNGWLANYQLAPVTPPHFPFNIEYGYHFDSGLLGQFLAEHAVQKLGVTHIQANVKAVMTAANGNIDHISCKDHDDIYGDFFIDCTGFKSMLLQDTLGVPFQSFSDNLFNDSAVVFPTEVMSDLPVETRATALSAGWTWQIPLTHRTGNGYVYSSKYITSEEAEDELRRHLGLGQDAQARHLTMRVGQVEQHWAHNCIGLGLSQGFIEPLEATALHLVQTSVEIFMDEYEKGSFTSQQRDNYNATITERFDRVRDYIVAHYKLNTRNDSQYWKDNRNNNNLSEPLLKLLDVWFRKGDLTQEIHRQNLVSHFGATSWHCLLAGYGTFPPLSSKQPGTGCQYAERELESFFAGCMLNFQTQKEALSGL